MKPTLPVAIAVLAASALAQTTVYRNASPRASATVIAGSNIGAPSLRYWGGSTTDGTRMFVFGGRLVFAATGRAGSIYYNGLYAYNPTTNTWANLSPDGDPTAPSRRSRAAVAYDPIGHRIVVFGGVVSPTGTPFSDGFAFELGTNTWSPIPNANPGTTGPTARVDSKMAHDAATGALVLFGGQGAGGSSSRSADTWLLTGSTWTLLAATTSPPARSIFAMTARSAPYNDIVLFGGRGPSNEVLDGTWRFDGANATWVQITPSHGTVPVTFGGGNDAIYDPVRQVVTIINGFGTRVPPSNIGGGGSWTSEYDCVTGEWRAYGSDLADQGAPDPLIGLQQRFAVAFLNGKTYFWGGVEPSAVGIANLPFVKEYQAHPLASTAVYGTACAGSNGSTVNLTTNQAPWLGRTHTATATGLVPSSFAIGALGFASASTPMTGIVPGALPGCSLHTSLDLTITLTNTAGAAVLALPLPNNVALAGLSLFEQVIQIEPLPLAASSSNGLTLTFGAL